MFTITQFPPLTLHAIVDAFADKDKPATLPTIQEISTDPSQYDLDPERLLGIIEPHLCRELVCDVQTIFMFVFTDGGKFYMDLLHGTYGVTMVVPISFGT